MHSSFPRVANAGQRLPAEHGDRLDVCGIDELVDRVIAQLEAREHVSPNRARAVSRAHITDDNLRGMRSRNGYQIRRGHINFALAGILVPVQYGESLTELTACKQRDNCVQQPALP
mgnify:CR=1 FL=1